MCERNLGANLFFCFQDLKLTDFNRQDIQNLQPNGPLHDFSVDFAVSQILTPPRVKSTKVLS